MHFLHENMWKPNFILIFLLSDQDCVYSLPPRYNCQYRLWGWRHFVIAALNYTGFSRTLAKKPDGYIFLQVWRQLLYSFSLLLPLKTEEEWDNTNQTKQPQRSNCSRVRMNCSAERSQCFIKKNCSFVRFTHVCTCEVLRTCGKLVIFSKIIVLIHLICLSP